MGKSRFLLLFGLAGFLILFFLQQAFAVEVVLKKGKALQVKVLKISEKNVKVDLEGVEMVYPVDEIESINGMNDFSMPKLRELHNKAYKCVDEAVAAGPRPDEAKCEEGISIIKKIDELDLPDMPETLDMIEVTKRCKRHDESIPYIEKLLKKSPGDAKAHMELANVFRHSQQDKTMLPKAIAEYEKAVKLEGSNGENQYQIGLTYTTFSEYGKAIPYFEKAIALKTDRTEVYSYMGQCYNALGKNEEAIVVLQKAIELGVKNGNTYHWLSKAYEASGQSAKAAEFESKAKELGHNWH
ncbi:MAG: tetratricopeptide repeat protein [Candidatus Omnitrophota bacterium]